mgnify:CR=1 FL=1
MTNLAKILTVDEMKRAARRAVPKMFFEYADSGSYTEGTYRVNESDFAKISLKQKVAVNLEGRNLKTEMLGKTIVMVTLDPVAAAYANRVVFLADGQVVDDMDAPTPERVLDRMKQFGG